MMHIYLEEKQVLIYLWTMAVIIVIAVMIVIKFENILSKEKNWEQLTLAHL